MPALAARAEMIVPTPFAAGLVMMRPAAVLRTLRHGAAMSITARVRPDVARDGRSGKNEDREGDERRSFRHGRTSRAFDTDTALRAGIKARAFDPPARAA
jgi:hypothetical protein